MELAFAEGLSSGLKGLCLLLGDSEDVALPNPYESPQEVGPGTDSLDFLKWGYIPAAMLGTLTGLYELVMNGDGRYQLSDVKTWAPAVGLTLGLANYRVFLGFLHARFLANRPPWPRIRWAALLTLLVLMGFTIALALFAAALMVGLLLLDVFWPV